VTTRVATELATITAASNTKIEVALERLRGEVKGINDRLGNYVPQSCIEHNRDMAMATKRIADLEEECISLWKSVNNKVSSAWLWGLFTVSCTATGIMFVALLNHIGHK
jgi:hypothetical protein